ncbi:MAG: aldehyde ferredoxin oxidoreductase N-terminal domain-containing protein, partial [Promethearchaeota archaeon]
MTNTEGNSSYSFPEAKILDIDLTNKKISKKILPGDIYRLYPGGTALGVYLMLQEMAPNIDPFSPDNLLVFAVSPFAGLPISGTSRLTISTKSPLTGACGDSQGGGDFPAFLKANGYDAIIFRGKADSPTY